MVEGIKINEKFPCECGREHLVPIETIELDIDRINFLNHCERLFKGKNICIICDRNTHDSINQKIYDNFTTAGWKVSMCEFECEGLLTNNEYVLGKALASVPADADGILSIGAGTVSDLGRFIGSRMGKRFAHIITASSMDGYASNVAAIVTDGKKKILKDCRYPNGLFGDLEVLASQPMELIQSGFGDILGKTTTLADWVLAHEITGEYYCGLAEKIAFDTCTKCVENIKGIADRDREAVKLLTESLVMNGINMSIAGSTRPTSGSEHIFSHYMVDLGIKAGCTPPSHGKSVAYGTLIGTMLYEYIFNTQDLDSIKPIKEKLSTFLYSSDRVREIMKAMGISDNMGDYYLDKKALRSMILESDTPKKRYTVIRFLKENHLLEKAADYVAERI